VSGTVEKARTLSGGFRVLPEVPGEIRREGSQERMSEDFVHRHMMEITEEARQRLAKSADDVMDLLTSRHKKSA
jgi:hypothetical protein